MAQQTLADGATFLVQRTKINENFTEVYATGATNAANIATNTSNIATNTSNIATNTSNISSLTTTVSSHTTSLSTLTGYVQDIQVMAWSARDTPAGGAGSAIRFFTGTNAPGGFIMMVWNGSAWKVTAPTPIVTVTTAVNGVAQTAAQVIPGSAQSYNTIPAGLLGAGSSFRVQLTPAKTGTTDAMNIARIRLGTLNSTSDTQLLGLGSGGITNTDRERSAMVHQYIVTSATALQGVHGAIPAGGFLGTSGSATVNPTYTIPNHTTNALYITMECTMAGTTDTPQLGSLTVLLDP